MRFRAVMQTAPSCLLALVLATASANTHASDASPIPVYQIIPNPANSSANYLQTSLTHDIHRYASSPQLKDVVVMDVDGNGLPFRIIAAHAEVRQDNRRFEMRFFPVSGGSEPETWRSQGKTLVRVNDNAVSVVLDRSEISGEAVPLAPVDFYLLDIKDSEDKIDSIALEWRGPEGNQYLEVQVSGSDDLQTWSSIATETLVQLQKAGVELIRNQIPIGLRSGQYNYLRIRFLGDGKALSLERVYGESKIQTPGPAPMDTWQVQGELAESQDSLRLGGNEQPSPVAAWTYHRQDNAPLTRVNIMLGDTAYGDTIRLLSRAEEGQPWRQVYRGIWFNARVGSEWQHSGMLNVYANSDTYWRLELDQSMRGKVSPSLVFEHPRKTIQFIANNNPAYYIAVGAESTASDTATQVFSHLLGKDSVNWTDADTKSLHPTIAESADKATALNWTGLLFWAALLAAVALLVGLAARLYRQMAKADLGE